MFADDADKPALITRVNVTPIIDVALVLVIILLVTAPLLTVPDLPVRLPEARSHGVEDEPNISVTLSANGELAIDRDAVRPGDLEAELRARLQRPENAGILVLVRADADAPYTKVGALLDEARSAGAERVAIATHRRDVAVSTAVAPAAVLGGPAVAPTEAGR